MKHWNALLLAICQLELPITINKKTKKKLLKLYIWVCLECLQLWKYQGPKLQCLLKIRDDLS